MHQQIITTCILFGLGSCAFSVAEDKTAETTVDPATMKANSSYALGYQAGGGFAQQFERFGVTPKDIEKDQFVKGFFESIEGTPPSVKEEELQAAMQAFGESLQKREKDLAKSNQEAGEKFLAENGKREGVVTTKSGLQYEILNQGGKESYVEPKEGEAAKQFLVNYKGSLISGEQFDASPEGQPVPMSLQVVEGFREALTTMPVGAKWRLFLPSKLAYGEQRRSAEIGPNSTLVFELELVKIEDAPASPQGFSFPPPQQ